MLLTDVSVSDVQLYHADKKQFAIGMPIHASKKAAGNDDRPEQPYQAEVKLVPLLVLSSGNDDRLEQPSQAEEKLVPLLVLISGNDDRPEQLVQA